MPDTRRTRDATAQEDTLAHAAMLYWREGLRQDEIARRMGVSRATIVNYLRLARTTGIVEIRIRGESFAVSPLARRLAARHGLQAAYVAHDDDAPLSGEDAVARTATLAAGALSDLLEPGDRLGVAWGATVQRVAQAFPAGDVPGLAVVQLIGSMHARHLFAAETCTIEIARRTSAECRTLHAPAVLTTPDLARALRAEPIIARQFEEFDRLTKVIFSVGNLAPDTTLLTAQIGTSADLDAAAGRGARAVLCGRFVGADGAEIASPLHDRLMGVTLDQLRRVPVRMLVAAGLDKLDAVRALLAGGHATHLVTDERIARALTG